MKRFLVVFFSLLIIASGGLGVYYYMNKKPNTPPKKEEPAKKPTKYTDTGFNINLIKTVNSSYNNNYLISPYSIEIALNMLKAGATNNTLDEIEKVVGTRDINKVSKDVKIANAMFVKNKNKKDIKDDFYSLIKNKYDAEIIYDDFKTPDVINNWVNEKTDKMIPKVLEYIDPQFVMGLANAVAIDVKWQSEFECDVTKSEEFTKQDGTKYNVEMMHNSYKYESYKYFETNDAKGVILPYRSEDDSHLEFVGILPNDDASKYVESLTEEKIASIDNSAKPSGNGVEISLSLPRFKYDFSLDNFTDILSTMGIKDAFTEAASFNNISDVINLSVGTAIHKTHIELNEEGTKAAAVTFFGIRETAIIDRDKPQIIEIKFNKPFVYMIRDSKTKEILFFGVTYEPNKWEKTTCEE